MKCNIFNRNERRGVMEPGSGSQPGSGSRQGSSSPAGRGVAAGRGAAAGQEQQQYFDLVLYTLLSIVEVPFEVNKIYKIMQL